VSVCALTFKKKNLLGPIVSEHLIRLRPFKATSVAEYGGKRS
jgi:hypothetical protein